VRGVRPLDQLVAFKHVEKPKGLPLAELVALFELLGLAEGLIRNENTHDEAVKQLRIKANELTEMVVTVVQHVQTGLPCCADGGPWSSGKRANRRPKSRNGGPFSSGGASRTNDRCQA